jgi:hypothetical protein
MIKEFTDFQTYYEQCCLFIVYHGNRVTNRIIRNLFKFEQADFIIQQALLNNQTLRRICRSDWPANIFPYLPERYEDQIAQEQV